MAKPKFGINLPTKVIFVSTVTLVCFTIYRFNFENYASLHKRQKIEREADMLYEKQRETDLSRVKIN